MFAQCKTTQASVTSPGVSSQCRHRHLLAAHHHLPTVDRAACARPWGPAEDWSGGLRPCPLLGLHLPAGRKAAEASGDEGSGSVLAFPSQRLAYQTARLLRTTRLCTQQALYTFYVSCPRAQAEQTLVLQWPVMSFVMAGPWSVAWHCLLHMGLRQRSRK